MEILTGTLETFNEILAEMKESKDAVEASYNVNDNSEIVEVKLEINQGYCTDYQLIFKRYQLDENKIEVYAENQNNGETATVIIGDIADTKLYIANHVGYRLNKMLDKLETRHTGVHETITQSVARIEKQIYAFDYDELPDYLKGVRDFMNLINGEEENISIADYIINQFREF